MRNSGVTLVGLSSALLLLAVSGCAFTQKRAVGVCGVMAVDPALPPYLECTQADGSEVVIQMRDADAYICHSPDDYERLLKR
jgi:hypothetical protein